MLCIYCSEREANSRDEVFTDFLGGRAWVPACARCNNTFGHSIEAATLRGLQKLMLILRLSGMPSSKPMTWKNVPLGEGGEAYDIDQDLNASPSLPVIMRNDDGSIRDIRGGLGHAKNVARGMRRSGAQVKIQCIKGGTIKPDYLRFQFPLDHDVLRTCIKMSVAAAERAGLSNVRDLEAREFLQKSLIVDVAPARVDVNLYPDLDRLHPPAGHLIYVEAISSERRVYSVVQLFSALQFYCELSKDYHGPDRAILATHNPVNHDEHFADAVPLGLYVPLRHLSGTPAEASRLRFEQLARELKALYGDAAIDSFLPAWAHTGSAAPLTPTTQS